MFSIKSKIVATDSVFGSFRFKGSKSNIAFGATNAAATPTARADQQTARLLNRIKDWKTGFTGIIPPPPPLRKPRLRGITVNSAGKTVILAKKAMNMPVPAINPSSARPR